MLGEYESCKECLEEFKTFIVDNKLNDRDTLLLLNENSAQKRAKVVDEFSDIAARITAFNPASRIDREIPTLLTTESENGGNHDEQE